MLGAARMWPTSTTMDSRASGGNPNTTGTHGTTLTDATVRSSMWGTPVARDDQKTPEAALESKLRMGGGRTALTSLNVQTKAWSTPRASMNENRTAKDAPSHGVTHGRTLAGQAATFPTPKTTDAKTASPGDANRNAPGLRALTITTDGPTTSRRADLNPFFVASLMGLPMDWLTHSTSEVTAWCRNALHTPGGNSSPEPVGASHER